ncbi:hypothetical protein HDV05_005289 [Chytridiales sp. JEL 0842]|nr:hypothetical protein HDV05_005289 [Chytridiales sp. JEL 0842]
MDQSALVELGRRRLKQYQKKAKKEAPLLPAVPVATNGNGFYNTEEEDANTAAAAFHNVVQRTSLEEPIPFTNSVDTSPIDFSHKQDLPPPVPSSNNSPVRYDAPKDSDTIESLQSFISLLQENNLLLSNQNKTLEDHVAAAQQQYVEIVEKTRTQGKIIEDLENKLELLAADPNNERASVDPEILNQYGKKIAELEALLEEKTSKLDSFFISVKEADERTGQARLTAERLAAELKDQTEKYQSEKEELSRQLDSYATQLNESHTTIQSLEDSVMNLKKEIVDEREKTDAIWSDRIQQLKSDHLVSAARQDETIEALKKSCSDVENERLKLSEMVGTTNSRLSALQQENTALLDQLEEMRVAYVRGQNEYSGIVDALHSEKSKVKALQLEIQNLKSGKSTKEIEENPLLSPVKPSTSPVKANDINKRPPSPVKTDDNKPLPSPTKGIDNKIPSVPPSPDRHALSNTAEPNASPKAPTQPPPIPPPPSEPAISHETYTLLLQKVEHLQKALEETKLDHVEKVERLQKSLAEEQRISALLSAEVQCLPDYIQLYHQERKALKAKLRSLGVKPEDMDMQINVPPAVARGPRTPIAGFDYVEEAIAQILYSYCRLGFD